MAPTSSEKQLNVIRRCESDLFWVEKIMIVTLILLPICIDNYIFTRFVFLNIILGFIASNVSYVLLFMERQRIRPFSFEPCAFFYIERVEMGAAALYAFGIKTNFGWGRALNTFGTIKTNFALHILILMQLFLTVQYILKYYKGGATESSNDGGSKMVGSHEGSVKKAKIIISKCFQYCHYVYGLGLLSCGCVYDINACWVHLWNSETDAAVNVSLLPDEPKREEEEMEDDSKDAAVKINLLLEESKREEEMEDEAEVESESESENMSDTESEEKKEDETDSESVEEDEDETASESEEESEDAESEEDETDSESEEEIEDETDSVSVKVGVKEIKIMNHAMDLCTKLLREISGLKENLTSKFENYRTKVEAERRKWEEEKENLSSKIKHYQSAEAEYAADRQKWDEEKEALNKRIQNYEREQSIWEKQANFFQETQEVLNNYSKHLEEKRKLEVELEFNKKLVEEYKVGYCWYKGNYFKLREENLDQASRLSTEASVAERLQKENGELEAKCRRLEEENGALTGKLSAAREACELYRSYLRDLSTGFNSARR
ncbi:hypothetical protein SLEP1_g33659 [Rubroshorea leprosula]|uniref:Uncharacterized protein n=1 Tax=Rubroshorea leprosula TaxID=152421 RepID=A0AAV5KHC0_9ROSI|nr:hypothetical protein SLEP1_g33659 [Rubroshorea leprosula]